MNSDDASPLKIKRSPVSFRAPAFPLSVIAIGQVATGALLGAQLGMWNFDAIEQHCRESVYWSEFCQLVKAGDVPENWLPGALGWVVIHWAKGKE